MVDDAAVVDEAAVDGVEDEGDAAVIGGAGGAAGGGGGGDGGAGGGVTTNEVAAGFDEAAAGALLAAGFAAGTAAAVDVAAMTGVVLAPPVTMVEASACSLTPGAAGISIYLYSATTMPPATKMDITAIVNPLLLRLLILMYRIYTNRTANFYQGLFCQIPREPQVGVTPSSRRPYKSQKIPAIAE